MISFPVPASQQQQQQNGEMRADKEEHFVYEACYDPFRHTPLGGQLQQQQQQQHHQQQQQHQQQAQLGPVEQFQQPPDLHPFPAPFQAPPDPRHFEPHQFHAPGPGPGPDAAHQFQVPDPVAVHQFQAPDPLPQFQPGDLPGLSVRPVPSRRGGSGGGELSKPSSVRKFHKADREKLRRDKLNEQFAELAGVLDPDRPKNDKATILGDSVQTVRELRAEVKRLKAEHDALLDESRDLTQEKSELREEKSSLQTDTDSLQAQLQQRLQLIMPWVGMDVSAMMGGSPYPYPPVPMPPAAARPQGGVAAPGTAPPPPGQAQQQQQQQHALPYVPAPGPGGGFPMHPPPLQAFAMFGGRHGDGAVPPYMHYPHYPPPPSHSHVERPYAQYPSAMQPPPGYLMQMQAQVSAAPGPPFYRPYGAPGMPPTLPPPPPPAHEISQSGPEAEQSTSSHQPPSSHDHTDVQTVLQLKTGGNSSASGQTPQSTQGAGAGPAAGGKAQQPASTASASSSLQKESVKREDSSAAPQASDASTPLDLSLRTTSAAPTASSQSASSAGSDVEGARGVEDRLHNQEPSQQRRSLDIQNPTTP